MSAPGMSDEWPAAVQERVMTLAWRIHAGAHPAPSSRWIDVLTFNLLIGMMLTQAEDRLRRISGAVEWWT